MIQLLPIAMELGAAAKVGPRLSDDFATASPRVWGLTPRQLHDAYWRSKGVQCVRRGGRHRLQRGAELFLLLEPGQMVLFNIAKLSERITWRDAIVTRLHLTNEQQRRYSEHVVTDPRGLVVRIERRYRPKPAGAFQVLLTPSRRVARAWMNAANRREGWSIIRRSVAWTDIDRWRCPGACYQENRPRQEREMLEDLIERWPHPDQVITGIEQIEPGVWGAIGESRPRGAALVGPLWLGRGQIDLKQPCLVGPACIEDQEVVNLGGDKLILRDISDVELPEPDTARPGRQSANENLYPVLKRAIDFAGSAVALVLLSPIMLLVALCILAEDGRPLFFGHVRQGRGGRMFRCWKFRTMHRDAEKDARKLKEQNICDGPQVYIRNDPRVTRVGAFLRATDLDEVPQFWNVLAGHMSLVGPRPSPDDENQFCPAWRDLRLSVRPGITGLWQLKRTRGRGQDFQEWIRYDIEYVQKASLWLDLQIIWRTAKLLIKRRTARASQ